MEPTDHFYRCPTCERDYHATEPLTNCLAPDCGSTLDELEAVSFAERHPEYAPVLVPDEPEPDAELTDDEDSAPAGDE